MKNWLPIIILVVAVGLLCVWDGIYTKNTFDGLQSKAEIIVKAVENKNESFEELNKQITNLNDYWTDKCNVLCLSVSRRDLQPVSDYIQYLRASIENEDIDNCLVYARVLDYNIKGLAEANGIRWANLL